jgi:hypothetical protein
MYRALESESKYDAQKIIDDKNGSEKYMNTFNKLDYKVKNGIKER